MQFHAKYTISSYYLKTSRLDLYTIVIMDHQCKILFIKRRTKSRRYRKSKFTKTPRWFVAIYLASNWQTSGSRIFQGSGEGWHVSWMLQFESRNPIFGHMSITGPFCVQMDRPYIHSYFKLSTTSTISTTAMSTAPKACLNHPITYRQRPVINYWRTVYCIKLYPYCVALVVEIEWFSISVSKSKPNQLLTNYTYRPFSSRTKIKAKTRVITRSI